MKKFGTLVPLALALSACATSPAPRPGSTPPASSPTPTHSASPVSTTNVTVYYLVPFKDDVRLAPERRRVAKTAAMARSVIEELVHGTPQDPDHSTPFPKASTINSVIVQEGLAIVDWSADVLEASVGAEVEAMGIQSAVYTLTQFPSITKVRFTVEGKDRGTASNGRTIEDWWGHAGLAGQPWDRDAAIDTLEPITLFTPVDGSSSSGRLSITGEASVFEATVSIVLKDASGKVIKKSFATASAGAPGRGNFSKAISFTPPATAQMWTLQVFERSAEDGSVLFMEDRSIKVG